MNSSGMIELIIGKVTASLSDELVSKEKFTETTSKLCTKIDMDNKHYQVIGNVNNFKKRLLDSETLVKDLARDLKKYKD